MDDHRGSFRQNCWRNRARYHWSHPSSGISVQNVPKTDMESAPALWLLSADFAPLFWFLCHQTKSWFHCGSNHLLAPHRSGESERNTVKTTLECKTEKIQITEEERGQANRRRLGDVGSLRICLLHELQ